MPQFATPLPNQSSGMKKVLIAVAIVAVVLVVFAAWALRKNLSSVSDDTSMPPREQTTNGPTPPGPDEIQKQLDALKATTSEDAQAPTPKEIEKQLDELKKASPEAATTPAPSAEEIQKQLETLSNTK